MRRAQAKIKSQRGATLMLALLLFLVCAVLGSVVLMAGTAAAGRLSQLSRMEQRYYAVTSAANLLREKLCTETGETVVCTRKAETTRTISYNPDTLGPASDPTYTYVWPTDTKSDTLAQRLARYVVMGDPNADNTTKWELTTGKADPTASFSLPAVQLDASGMNEALTVQVKATMETDRTITLEITNNKDGDKTPYTLIMTLAPKLERSKGESVSVSVESGLETTTTALEYRTKVSWSISGIQTLEN